ncbi:hypothetical protein [Niastella sp. OAS944]|uniref:hypothetical protein n=1 Tax=Niastella sp. OAS944 TaxID=2664089 RepID=UPI00346BBDF4|nr:hypothetical protein [Chitinophagaceae bacterium OAS944]
MELPEFIERNVTEFMKPIQDAGYTNLPREKSTGSLEAQLKSYLLFAFHEQARDRVSMVWYGEDLENSNFSLTITTTFNSDPIQFTFKGKFDPKYEYPAELSGLQVSKGDHNAFYPYSRNGKLPEPKDVYQASIQPLQMKSTKCPRLIKKWFGGSRKL